MRANAHLVGHKPTPNWSVQSELTFH